MCMHIYNYVRSYVNEMHDLVPLHVPYLRAFLVIRHCAMNSERQAYGEHVSSILWVYSAVLPLVYKAFHLTYVCALDGMFFGLAGLWHSGAFLLSMGQ